MLIKWRRVSLACLVGVSCWRVSLACLVGWPASTCPKKWAACGLWSWSWSWPWPWPWPSVTGSSRLCHYVHTCTYIHVCKDIWTHQCPGSCGLPPAKTDTIQSGELAFRPARSQPASSLAGAGGVTVSADTSPRGCNPLSTTARQYHYFY